VTQTTIFIQRADEYPKVKTVAYLSDLTDELQECGSGSYIEEFVSGGPQNYAFSAFCSSNGNPTRRCRVKGLIVNYENSKVINFTSIRIRILEVDPRLHVKNPKKIKRKHSDILVSEPESKQYTVDFMNRRLTNNFDSFPHGYQ
jgi:hypothetical protein